MCLVANYRVALDHLRVYTSKTHLAARQAAFHSLPSEHPRQRLLMSESTPESTRMRSLSHCQVRRINQVIFSPEVDWSSTVISMPYNIFSVNIRLYLVSRLLSYCCSRLLSAKPELITSIHSQIFFLKTVCVCVCECA